MPTDDGFDDVLLPIDISYGVVGGAEFSTTITINTSGYEQRNENWEQERGRWDVAHGLKTIDQLAALMDLFKNAKGKLRSFRYRDWTDYKASMLTTPPTFGVTFGTGNGILTTFQLYKPYTTSAGTYNKKITKPVDASVYPDEFEQTTQIWDATNPITIVASAPTAGQCSIDYNTGIVTFGFTPADTNDLTWLGDFHKHVRFDDDHMKVEAEFFARYNWPIPIVEVRD